MMNSGGTQMSRLSAAIKRVVLHQNSIPSRSAGYHNDRLDGVSDILNRARDASVLDIGCNRGLVSFQFVQNGATLIHGCDIHEKSLETARELFSELPAVSRFENVDLTGGAPALQRAFGLAYKKQYDIVLFLAVYQKLERIMQTQALTDLVAHLADKTGRYFVLRNHPIHRAQIEPILANAGLRCVQYSELSDVTVPKTIYAREQ
jgi:2-polyprenyl-3-methyl-5-hydroxy-6-metoxy-1,4-benzoquinol methylase